MLPTKTLDKLGFPRFLAKLFRWHVGKMPIKRDGRVKMGMWHDEGAGSKCHEKRIIAWRGS